MPDVDEVRQIWRKRMPLKKKEGLSFPKKKSRSFCVRGVFVGDHANNVCERRDQEWEKQVIGCSLHLALQHFNFDTHPQFSCSSTINFLSLSITLPTTTTFVRCTPITLGYHKQNVTTHNFTTSQTQLDTRKNRHIFWLITDVCTQFTCVASMLKISSIFCVFAERSELFVLRSTKAETSRD